MHEERRAMCTQFQVEVWRTSYHMRTLINARILPRATLYGRDINKSWNKAHIRFVKTIIRRPLPIGLTDALNRRKRKSLTSLTRKSVSYKTPLCKERMESNGSSDIALWKFQISNSVHLPRSSTISINLENWLLWQLDTSSRCHHERPLNLHSHP